MCSETLKLLYLNAIAIWLIEHLFENSLSTKKKALVLKRRVESGQLRAMGLTELLAAHGFDQD